MSSVTDQLRDERDFIIPICKDTDRQMKELWKMYQEPMKIVTWSFQGMYDRLGHKITPEVQWVLHHEGALELFQAIMAERIKACIAARENMPGLTKYPRTPDEAYKSIGIDVIGKPKTKFFII
jgi:hypothetical protein